MIRNSVIDRKGGKTGKDEVVLAEFGSIVVISPALD